MRAIRFSEFGASSLRQVYYEVGIPQPGHKRVTHADLYIGPNSFIFLFL